MKGETTNKIKVENYGDMLAKINDQELVSFETDGGYQGHYLVVCKDNGKLYYYVDWYGSCSGCDWLENRKDWDTGEVLYTDALEYCGGIKPAYIVPENMPLFFKKEEYLGFTLLPTN